MRRPRRIEPEDLVLERLLHADAPSGIQRLLEVHGGRVVGMLRARFPRAFDRAGIDDVLALAIERAWRARKNFRAELGTARAWFGAIARNCARWELSRRRRMELLLDDLDQRAAGTADRVDSAHQQLVVDLHSCIERLPDLQRLVLLADLAAHGRAKGKELADNLGVTPGQVYLARMRGLQTLRREMSALGYALAGDDGRRQVPRDRRARWSRSTERDREEEG